VPHKGGFLIFKELKRGADFPTCPPCFFQKQVLFPVPHGPGHPEYFSRMIAFHLKVDDRSEVMAKPSHREKLLTNGLRVMHERGFVGASVRDIVKAAGVPQGSFTNHFASKEAFSLEVLDLYFAHSSQLVDSTLRNDALPPLKRLGLYLEANHDSMSKCEMKNGCLYGNFSAEASDHSEVVRERLVQIFQEIQQAIAYCLKAAVKTKELPPKFKAEEMAGFILASFQGAILLAKVQRSSAPVDSFKKIVFSTLLR
jgi:TetR/AcrR family transcriptional repressor of nem operon